MSSVAPPPSSRGAGWVTRGFAIAFWLFAVAGAFSMIAAWFWFGLSYFEEQTEQGKAVAAGTTMEGLGALLGIPPLVIAHLIGLGILCPIAIKGRHRPGSGALFAVVAVVVASLIGVCVGEIVSQGQLFTMGAGAADHMVP